MKARRIELLVLDGQGVVFTDPLATFLEELADVTGQARDALRARWHGGLRERAWRGTIDDDALWLALAGGDGHRWAALFESSYGPGPAAPRLSDWASIVPIWLLTNHRTPWIDRRLQRLGLGRWLARVLVSDAIGALKPEPAAFAHVLAHVRDPATVLFVDDQEKNVSAAAALGLSSLLADPAGRWTAAVDQCLGSRGT